MDKDQTEDLFFNVAMICAIAFLCYSILKVGGAI